MREIKGNDALVETMVSPMYMEVPGHEIDRIRRQLNQMFNTENEKDTIKIAVAGEHFLLQLAVQTENLHQLLDHEGFAEFVKEQNEKDSKRNLSSLLHTVGEEFTEERYRQGIDRDRGLQDSDLGTEFIFYCMLQLYKEYKDGKGEVIEFTKPGKILYLSSIAYRRLNGKPQSMFSAIWGPL